MTSCALSGDEKESLANVNNVKVTEGGESLTISSFAVPNASYYRNPLYK